MNTRRVDFTSGTRKIACDLTNFPLNPHGASLEYTLSCHTIENRHTVIGQKPCSESIVAPVDFCADLLFIGTSQFLYYLLVKNERNADTPMTFVGSLLKHSPSGKRGWKRVLTQVLHASAPAQAYKQTPHVWVSVFEPKLDNW
jgi:hypothetical protein